ncbi:hypothetical protein B296_00008701 [Ensete ventricosum]|uniref:Uncharacterized protein n=1 Tax=Ensete ventricosum TaxID=4639 RepID=A0A426X4S7_ENSVE|nr:hypothetical protein B296_00008701 [Ensete ventricosum]
MVPQRRVLHVCASKLTSDESLGHQHMGAVYHRGRSQIASTSESHGGDLIIQGMIEVVGELDCFSAHIRLREPDKSEDKAEYKVTDSRAMGLTAPWYRRGGTSMESMIPCSHGGRALVVKGTEEVENIEANSKYQDRAEGHRSSNFIRPMSMGFSSR